MTETTNDRIPPEMTAVVAPSQYERCVLCLKWLGAGESLATSVYGKNVDREGKRDIAMIAWCRDRGTCDAAMCAKLVADIQKRHEKERGRR